MSNRPIYGGPMQKHLVSRDVWRGIICYWNQKQRCRDSRYYAGISVKYSCREFVAWWLENLKGFKGKTPTCGRIDHAGDYTFDNIVIQDRCENSLERCTRLPPPAAACKKPVIVFRNGVFYAAMPSASDAAKLAGVSASVVSRACLGRRKDGARGWSFYFNLADKEEGIASCENA